MLTLAYGQRGLKSVYNGAITIPQCHWILALFQKYCIKVIESMDIKLLAVVENN